MTITAFLDGNDVAELCALSLLGNLEPDDLRNFGTPKIQRRQRHELQDEVLRFGLFESPNRKPFTVAADTCEALERIRR